MGQQHPTSVLNRPTILNHPAVVLTKESLTKKRKLENAKAFEQLMDSLNKDIPEKDILTVLNLIQGCLFTDIPTKAAIKYHGNETPLIWIIVCFQIIFIHKNKGIGINRVQTQNGVEVDYWSYVPDVTVATLPTFRQEWVKCKTIDEYVTLFEKYKVPQFKQYSK